MVRKKQVKNETTQSIKKATKQVKEEAKEAKDDFKKEYLFNIPTYLNATRIILSCVVVYLIITRQPIELIVTIFAIAAITDFFDGKIARKYNLANPFGAKSDMVSDRVLWVSVAIALFIVYSSDGLLKELHLMQLLFMMSREIIAGPFAISSIILGTFVFPKTRYIAKITTFFQGFGFSGLMLSLFYPSWIYFSLPISILVLLTGTISGLLYVKDLRKLNKK